MLAGYIMNKIRKKVIKNIVQGSYSSDLEKKFFNTVKSVVSTVNSTRELRPIPIIREQFRTKVTPKFGSVVKVDLVGVFEHSGIYLGDNKIAVANGNGCIVIESCNEFADCLKTGITIYCSVDKNNNAIGKKKWGNYALKHIGTQYDYSLFAPNKSDGQINCHNFVISCISKNYSDNKCWTFAELESVLQENSDFDHWQPCWRKFRDG